VYRVSQKVTTHCSSYVKYWLIIRIFGAMCFTQLSENFKTTTYLKDYVTEGRFPLMLGTVGRLGAGRRRGLTTSAATEGGAWRRSVKQPESETELTECR